MTGPKTYLKSVSKEETYSLVDYTFDHPFPKGTKEVTFHYSNLESSFSPLVNESKFITSAHFEDKHGTPVITRDKSELAKMVTFISDYFEA